VYMQQPEISIHPLIGRLRYNWEKDFIMYNYFILPILNHKMLGNHLPAKMNATLIGIFNCMSYPVRYYIFIKWIRAERPNIVFGFHSYC
ncbi:hypothetical protein DXC87_16590, partial [Blautia obeum]|uniref:hypothetical protein n=1 Tax=Blautia obeum TaxID=40520 RepID=UPI000EE92070